MTSAAYPVEKSRRQVRRQNLTIDSGRPRISVIVPARNEEETLPRTLPSIVESIGALPGTAEIIVVIPEESPFAAHPPMRADFLKWVTIDIPGKYEALRKGMSECDGDIVAFLDADVLPSRDSLVHLVDAFRRPGTDVAAGRIVLSPQGGTPLQRLLEMWTSVSIAAWHRLRSQRPDLRWALPGALYAFRRQWFPSSGVFVATLDDASIGISMIESGARISYVPEATVAVGAARSLRQWYRQKLRIRRGWKLLKDVRPERVSLLQSTLSDNVVDLCRGSLGKRLLRRLDRAIAVLAEKSRASDANQSGIWQPDRAGWNLGAGGSAAPLIESRPSPRREQNR